MVVQSSRFYFFLEKNQCQNNNFLRKKGKKTEDNHRRKIFFSITSWVGKDKSFIFFSSILIFSLKLFSYRIFNKRPVYRKVWLQVAKNTSDSDSYNQPTYLTHDVLKIEDFSIIRPALITHNIAQLQLSNVNWIHMRS